MRYVRIPKNEKANLWLFLGLTPHPRFYPRTWRTKLCPHFYPRAEKGVQTCTPDGDSRSSWGKKGTNEEYGNKKDKKKNQIFSCLETPISFCRVPQFCSFCRSVFVILTFASLPFFNSRVDKRVNIGYRFCFSSSSVFSCLA